jgi:hypothetical protein
MIIVTATISITSATVAPTNQDWDRRMVKPVSAAISNAAAINSAIRPNPCEVIIALTAQPNGVTPRPFLGAVLPHVAPLMRATDKTTGRR